jgi:hypothetical protein
MTETTPALFAMPASGGKPVIAAFDGGAQTSDIGVALLAAVERRFGFIDRLAELVPDRRDPARVTHRVGDMLRARVLAIAAGYEDVADLDAIRRDPAFLMALGREPETGPGLCSKPTMHRLENAPDRAAGRAMFRAIVDWFCMSFPSPPGTITLDIDETPDAVHGGSQLALFNGHYGMTCHLPIHIYHVETGRPVAVLLRPASRPRAASCARSCGWSCGVSAAPGPGPPSPGGAMGATPRPRPWAIWRPRAAATFAACPPTAGSTRCSPRRPMR